MKIRCKQVKKSKTTTDSNHKLPVAPNLLNQDFAVPGPNLAWVADITYVATEEGWLYLAAIKDLWNREIVGYAMSHRMTQDLVGRALFRAVAARRPPAGLIHHSDRGSQHCSHRHQKLMKQFKMKPSMSRKGNCRDNASMEIFFGRCSPPQVSHPAGHGGDQRVHRSVLQPAATTCQLGQPLPGGILEEIHQTAGGCLTIRWCPLLRTDLTLGENWCG